MDKKNVKNALPSGEREMEMETFLTKDTSKQNGTAQNGYIKAYIVPKSDPEAGDNILYKVDSFDPFRERRLENPTSDLDTLTHLLKASLGTGILAMPDAFKNSGLVVGIFATIIVAFVCTHCAYILVKCAHELYKRKRVHSMTFSEVSVAAFESGPPWARCLSKPSRIFIQLCLFVTYFGTCSVYTVIISENLRQIIDYYTGGELNERIMIAALIIPIILLAWVPDLKYLAPFSMIANLFMGIGLVITLYYIIMDMTPDTKVNYVSPISQWPQFVGITIFAMEAIGVVMPLENSMKTPQHFTGLCGVLNKGMSGVTMVYILLGFLGYLSYGDGVQGSITLNLKIQLIGAQIVRVLISLAVYCTFGLQFYVCLDIGWNEIKSYYTKRPMLANYIMRTILAGLCVLLAVAVPTIGPFIGLIGAFCFSILGILVPVFIELVTYWNKGFGPFGYLIWKNVLVTIFGLMALVFGSMLAIKDIIALYK